MVQKDAPAEMSQSRGLSAVKWADSLGNKVDVKKYEELITKLNQALSRQPSTVPTAASLAGKENSGRDSAVSTIRCLNVFYGFGPETFATAVNYIDRVLSKVKVQLKYYSCLASACFLLAAKFHQEPENVPGVDELVSIHRQLWKSSDLKRMELVVLEKLKWEMWPVTCPEIAKLYCDILTLVEPNIHRSHLDDILQKFEVCINYKFCAIYTSATLAISLLQLTLKESGLLSPRISQALLQLHTLAKVTDSEAYECYTTVLGVLDNYHNNPNQHPSCLPLPKPTPRINLVSRPSLYGDSELPTIEEDLHWEQGSHVRDIPLEYRKPKFKDFIHQKSWSSCLLPPKSLTCSVD